MVFAVSSEGPAPTSRAERSRLREFFTLRSEERRARQLSDFDRTEIRGEIERAVDTMREAEQAGVSFVRARLARQAATQVIIAVAAAQQLASDPRREEWPNLEQAIVELSSLPGWNSQRPALALLPGSDTLTDAEFRLLADLFAYVERLVDLRSPRDFWVARWTRRVGLLLLVLGGSWFALKPPNLARGKMVTSSSICGDMPDADRGLSRLSRVVDGVRRENSHAVCTHAEKKPWITVDLGAPHSLSKIVVYPQSDGAWSNTDEPLQLRVSLDNEHFEVVGERAELFTPDFPWSLELPRTRAQYVQLLGVRRTAQKLILNEIEVYGR